MKKTKEFLDGAGKKIKASWDKDAARNFQLHHSLSLAREVGILIGMEKEEMSNQIDESKEQIRKVDVLEVIANDKDLRKLLMRAFMWEGHPLSVADEITKMRGILWEKYQIDIEILC